MSSPIKEYICFGSKQKELNMRKIVITYGAIAGLIVTAPMFAAMFTGRKDIDFGLGEVFGYAIMILAFSMVFVGIRSLRNNEMEGKITFGKGLITGLYITLIASIVYCTVWELYLDVSGIDFMADYSAQYLEKMKEQGASEQEIAEMTVEMDAMSDMYKNPFSRIGITFVEIFPVGLIVSLICAGILKRKESMPTAD